MKKKYLEIRSDSKGSKTFLFTLIFLASSFMIAGTVTNLIQGEYRKEFLEPTFIALRLIFLFLIVFSSSKLLKETTIILKSNCIIVLHPFKFKKKTYPLNSIQKYSVKITKVDSGNGPEYIDFPYQTLQIHFKDNYKININSKDNTNIKELIDEFKKDPNIKREA